MCRVCKKKIIYMLEFSVKGLRNSLGEKSEALSASHKHTSYGLWLKSLTKE